MDSIFSGDILWLYGYFSTGNPSLVDWHAYTPWWIADYLPNIESEMGMALVWAAHGPRLLANSTVTTKVTNQVERHPIALVG